MEMEQKEQLLQILDKLIDEMDDHAIAGLKPKTDGAMTVEKTMTAMPLSEDTEISDDDKAVLADPEASSVDEDGSVEVAGKDPSLPMDGDDEDMSTEHRMIKRLKKPMM